MLWQTLSALVLGLAVAHAALRLAPARLPNPALALATGPAAALVGAGIGRAVLGGGPPAAATLAIALVVSAALVSLLVRPAPAAPPLAHRAG